MRNELDPLVALSCFLVFFKNLIIFYPLSSSWSYWCRAPSAYWQTTSALTAEFCKLRLWMIIFLGFRDRVCGFRLAMSSFLSRSYFDSLFRWFSEYNLLFRTTSDSFSAYLLQKLLSSAISSLFWKDEVLFLMLMVSSFLQSLTEMIFLVLVAFLIQLCFLSLLYRMQASCISLVILILSRKMEGVASCLQKRGIYIDQFIFWQGQVLNLSRTLGRSHLVFDIITNFMIVVRNNKLDGWPIKPFYHYWRPWNWGQE